MNEWKKGSFTVESAFLIPMAVMLKMCIRDRSSSLYETDSETCAIFHKSSIEGGRKKF